MAVSLFTVTNSETFHMEEDLDDHGKILFTDTLSIKTTDGMSTSIVVGSEKYPGYVDGVGEAARFNGIYGFTQLNTSLVVVADSSSHCLRFVDRVTNQTSTFIGLCTQRGFTDGEGQNALFDIPFSLMVFNSTSLLVSDLANNAIRLVDVETATVSTLITDILSPKGMEMADSSQQFYVLAGSVLALVDVESLTFEVLKSAEPGLQDGNLSSSQYMFPTSIDRLDNDTLVVADAIASRIRMISLSTGEVTSICAAVTPPARDTSDELRMDIDCPPYLALTVLKSGDALYIGGSRSINVVLLNENSTDAGGSSEGSGDSSGSGDESEEESSSSGEDGSRDSSDGDEAGGDDKSGCNIISSFTLIVIIALLSASFI